MLTKLAIFEKIRHYPELHGFRKYSRKQVQDGINHYRQFIRNRDNSDAALGDESVSAVDLPDADEHIDGEFFIFIFKFKHF